MKTKSFYFLTIVLLVCALKLVQIGYKRIHFSTDLFLNSFKKNFGEEHAVSENVLEAKKLILQSQISNFNLSNELVVNAYFRQRIIELSYPIRLNRNSKFLIVKNSEVIKCKLKSESKKFKFYEC